MLSSSFSNRELALCIWLALFTIFFLSYKSLRKDIPKLVTIIFGWKSLCVILTMLLYILSVLAILHNICFWDQSLLKDTLIWTLGVGFVMLLNVTKAIKNDQHFKTIVWQNIKLTVYVEFILNLYVFSLPIELLLSLLIIFLTLLQFMGTRAKRPKFSSFAERAMAIIGFTILAWAVYRIVGDYDRVLTSENLQSFLFPILMTLSYIPFLYMTAYYIYCEDYFSDFKNKFHDNPHLVNYAKVQIVKRSFLSMRKLRVIDKKLKAYRIQSKTDLNNELKEILD